MLILFDCCMLATAPVLCVCVPTGGAAVIHAGPARPLLYLHGELVGKVWFQEGALSMGIALELMFTETMWKFSSVRGLFQVGGFCASPLLQDAIREEFDDPGRELKVVVAPRPGLAVVSG